MKKRLMTVAVVLAVLAAACGGGADDGPADTSATGGAGALEKEEITVFAAQDAQMAAQMLVAKDQGFFEDEGLSVDTQFYSAGSEIPQGMASGDIQIGAAGWVNPVLLVTQGFDVEIIALSSDLAGNVGFVVRDGERYSSAKDFEGDRLGMLQVGIMNEVWTRVVERYDIDASKVQIVNADPAETLTAFQTDQIDVLLSWEPFLSRAAQSGGRVVLTGTTSYFDGEQQDRHYFGYGTIFATSAFIDANPNTLKAFLRAFVRANEMLVDKPEESARILAEPLGLREDLMLKVLEGNGYDRLQFTSEWFEQYHQINEYLHDVGELQQPAPRPEDFVNVELLEEVAPDYVP